jgi:hypothetical protein
MDRAPTHSLAQEDAPHLAPLDLDGAPVGSLYQGVEGPTRSGFGIRRHQRPLGLPHDRARRAALRQGDDLAALRFGQPRLAAWPRPVAQPVDALRIEAGKALTHRLRVAAQLGGDRRRPQTRPTPGNHPRPLNPVAGRVPALGEPTDLVLFSIIARSPGTQEFRHRRLPIILDDASILHHL